jgi:hypothetical protein
MGHPWRIVDVANCLYTSAGTWTNKPFGNVWHLKVYKPLPQSIIFLGLSPYLILLVVQICTWKFLSFWFLGTEKLEETNENY